VLLLAVELEHEFKLEPSAAQGCASRRRQRAAGSTAE
jgi:hypothetical protein